ncbi:MAG: PepSY-associated TM helix domain-containing protein [Caulobacteraceae bacterium]|nr:PepSY-associated TM helix domain-containing protein [Caulobacteraceae bacterium]
MAWLRVVHRWLGLALGAIWALQALTGMALMFSRPLDDWSLRASGRPADLAVVDRSLAAILSAHPGARIAEYLPSGGAPGQIDVLVKPRRGASRVVRIDAAAGAVLREGDWSGPPGRVSLIRAILLLHKQLWAGEVGKTLIGLSGLVLLGNLLAGLRLAWPARGRWRATLVPGRERTPVMGALGWHRAVALWLAPLALVTVVTGAGMAWSGELQRLFGVADDVRPAAARLAGAPIAPSAAARAALARYPGSSLADVVMPSAKAPWYLIRVRRPGEWRQVFGASLVYVDAHSGAVLAARDALAQPLAGRVIDGFYPAHTGEWAGLGGRIVMFGVGLWLVSTIGLGCGLWLTRRAARRARPRPAARAVQLSPGSLSE